MFVYIFCDIKIQSIIIHGNKTRSYILYIYIYIYIYIYDNNMEDNLKVKQPYSVFH